MRRVVVTGIGIVSPLGHDAKHTWDAVLGGANGAGPITIFDASAFPTRIAAEVKNWDSRAFIDRKLRRLLNRGSEFIVRAAQEAWCDSGLDSANRDGLTVSVVSAHSGARPFPTDVAWMCHETDCSKDAVLISPLDAMRGAYHTVGGVLARLFHATGPTLSLNTACASGTQALGLAMRMIADGEADIVVAGGGDSMIGPFDVLAFCTIGALSTRNSEPQRASRPFDAGRDGFVLGEGAAMLVLELEDHALARGASIYGEISGYGSSLNAYRITDSPPDGYGPSLSMRAALQESGLEAADIGYINAHGTSTRDNDASETKAIKQVFGEHAYSVSISSTKGSTGHLISGAGAIEAAFCLFAMRDGILPPTANLEVQDPDCDLNYLPVRATHRAVGACLSNSFGFGGTNATLVLRATRH